MEEAARDVGAAVRRGRAAELERDLPYGPMLDALGCLTHGLDDAQQTT